MGRKIFSLVLLFFSFYQLFPIIQSYALSIGIPIKSIRPIPVKNSNQTIFGEDHFYTVTFRGNGEAVVSMKAILTNTTNAPLSSIAIQLPSNISIENITAYQVIAQPQCVQYSNAPIDNPKCLQYQQPNYQYADNNTSYKKIAIQQMNNTIQLTLPSKLNVNDIGSYLLVYRTSSMANKNLFGAYSFKFTSIKVDDPINTLQIGIATDSDLYLKNAKGTVQYNTPGMSMAALPKAADSNIQNTEFNNFYNQIGDGTITKTATNLAPMESYTVNGMYADAGVKLYGKEIAITIATVLLLLIIIFGLAIFLLRNPNKTVKEDHKADERTKLFFITAGASFVSVLLACVYTIGLMLFFLFINTNNYYYQLNTMFLFMLLTALSGAVYLFLLFVPTIIITIKKGFIWGGAAFGLTIMWSIFALIFLFGIFFLFFSGNNGFIPPIVGPLPMAGTKALSVPLQNKGL